MLDFAPEKRQALIEALRTHVDGEVRMDDSTRRLYSTDASIYQVMPLGVVVPRTTDALRAAVQIALETHTPLISRGGGTSLTGQSIGPGLILDCSKYLNHVIDCDPAQRRVRVQPGMVLDHLNTAMAKYGLQFGPDVATANRATIGGMLGNNSAGSRSVKYGQTVHHVHRLQVILSDGLTTQLEELSPTQYDIRREARTTEGAGLRALELALTQEREEIIRRFPNILRRVSGYNLASYLPEFHDSRFVNGHPRRTLIPLVVGSEGTLAIITEAELHLVPRPAVRGLLVPHFESLRQALDAVAVCLEYQPSAVELMDAMLIRLARAQRGFQNMMAAIEGTPQALLMVEFVGDTETEVQHHLNRLQKRLREVAGLTACIPAMHATLRDPLWNLRSAAVPLLYGMPGDRKPVTFVEDCAVAPKRLPEFAERFHALIGQYGTEGAFYGHASVGCLHIRPVLNLKDTADVARMRAMTEDVTKLVIEFNGALSGEHGDGYSRSEWNRTMYGDAIYRRFVDIKNAFDPHQLLNPGKIVHAPAMTENLRFHARYQPLPLPVISHQGDAAPFFRTVEACNGSGVCRKTQGGSMCPSFRATRNEQDNTRGRANALRLAISGQTETDKTSNSPLAERWLHDVMDLCLSCKACKTECPSNVDMAKLKAEFQQAYYQVYRRPFGHRLVKHIHQFNRWGALVAPLANWLGRRRVARWFMELITGLDRRRTLPQFHRRHFRRWFQDRPKSTTPKQRKVLLFDDCLTTFTEPQIGQAAVTVLEAAGCEVELVNPICCGRAMISKGYLKEAKAIIEKQATELARRIAPGTVILGYEPSCILTLTDEWPELLPSEATRQIATAVHLADDWLATQLREQTLRLPLRSISMQTTLHGHCHQKALVGMGGTATLLQQIPGNQVTTLDAGCCGMAGAFGYEKSHYDISKAIAQMQLIPAINAQASNPIAVCGTSCRHQITDLTPHQPQHPLEILAAALQAS